MVQAQPTRESRRRPLVLSSLSLAARRREQTKNENPGTLLCRLDLNDPPTAMGGYSERQRAAFVCRLTLNHPPTAVGGIPGVFTEALTWVCAKTFLATSVTLF